jgi:hypothetical protein
MELLERMEQAGWLGQSVYLGDVEYLRRMMCRRLGWVYRKWPSVGRELA